MKKTKNTQDCSSIAEGIQAVLAQRLYPYQQTWMGDASRFKIGLWAWQTGKDFTCAAEAVVDCLLHPGSQWLIIACAERQAVESLQKVKDWAEAFGCAAEGNLSQLRFENGSRIVALPARPASIRGYSANLILTEFAFHDDPEAVWRAAFPIITNPGDGREKKVRIISTPNGQTNLFHRLWSGSAYSKHFVNIHQAIAQGLPLNAQELQSGLGDPEAWKQEYECQFIDTSAVLLPYDLLRACQSPHATHQCDPQTLSASRGPLYMGVAFEPSGTRAVCWTLEAVRAEESGLRLGLGVGEGPATHNLNPNLFLTRDILLLEDLSIPEQVQALLPRLRLARRIYLDATGAGSAAGQLIARHLHIPTHPMNHLSERMRQAFKLQQQPLTPALQNELYPRLQSTLQSKQVLLPEHPAVLDELHCLQATVSDDRQVRYRTSSSGCPEYLPALALAAHAALEHELHPHACATSVEVSSCRRR